MITLAVTMGAQIEGKELELKQNGVKNIKSGNYLLFLNPFRDEENHKLIFLNNSPYYLYKGNGHKFQNISSGSLDKITENELQKMKQKD